MIKFLKGLKNAVSPDYWANRIGERTGLYDKAREYGKKDKPWYIHLILMFVIIVLIFFASELQAGDNHVHIDQVGTDGDDLELSINQKGEGNKIDFSMAHNGNQITLEQYGSNNTISWVPYWGSGKSWGGDIDGSNNVLKIEQWNGATYGGHVWGDNNDIDVYQHGTQTHYLDIHMDDVDHNISQSGAGSSYSHVWYYGTADGSVANVTQTGGGSHSATITLQGSYPTTLNLIQNSATNQSYSVTQNCITVGGCSITVNQGN